MKNRLIASIVVHESRLDCLIGTIQSLIDSGRRAITIGWISTMEIHVVDNGSSASYRDLLKMIQHEFPGFFPGDRVSITLRFNPDNLGYARGHNSVPQGDARLRLILNPDVRMDPDSLVSSLALIHRGCGIGLVAPMVLDSEGKFQFSCKRYPSLVALFLRGLVPRVIRERMARMLEVYEMRDLNWNVVRQDLELVSGCCFLVDGRIWQELGGFSSEYFMYFEDFDFSMRIKRKCKIAYSPDFKIVHFGGGAARKGWRHIAWFIMSAWTFFNTYGWKFV